MINNVKCWICGSNKIVKINIVCNKNTKHLQCNQCYFVFKNTTIAKSKNVKYYSKLSIKKLIERYFANEYCDTARFLNYINLVVKKNSNLNKKINHLDIGGGYGFFSNVIKKKFPKINSYNLEPDKAAIKVVKKLNKNSKIFNLSFENIDLIKKIKFDLVTYWGGIYRTIEPDKVFRSLKKICNKNSKFFFSLPFSFEDMRVQHLDLQNSFDDYLLKEDANKSLFGRKHMKIFLSRNNFSYKEIIIQNKPFKKKVPIFYFYSKKKKLDKIKIKKEEFKNYFKKNIGIYNRYFENQIKSIVRNEKKINKLFVCGDNYLSEFALKYLKKINQNNLSSLKNNLDEIYEDNKKLKLLLNLSNMESNIFIILNNKSNKTTRYSLINRLHLNVKNKVFHLNDNFTLNEDIFHFDHQKYLKRKFNIVKI